MAKRKENGPACSSCIMGDWRLKIVVVGIIAVALIAVLYYIWIGEVKFSTQEISNEEGYAKLSDAETISIVMDVRGISVDHARQVYQCGVGYALSLSQLGKNVSNFAIANSECTRGDLSVATLRECDGLIKESDYAIVLKGTDGMPRAQFYEDHFLVEVNATSDTSLCKIAAKPK
ncbi:MAG: hypothetical protein QXU54_02150 [Candidatus Micrarchaeia archaeon]